jgi:GTP-binding protein Era
VTEPNSSPTETRAGFVAVIGAPNAGKSTLVNRLVGAKVSIVTQKVQTTRFPVRGVAIDGAVQLVLVDTPGIFKPRRRLDRAMVASAWSGAQDADAVVHLVDVQAEIAVKSGDSEAADRRSVDDVEAIVERLKVVGVKAILALNKIDGLKRENLLAVAETLFSSGVYDEVFMISALKGAGVDDLRAAMSKRMPPGPWLYPEDQIADAPERVLAAEITREKIYLRVHEELPYAAAVETTEFKELKDGSVRIEQTIYVERDGQRAIIIGKDGQTLKWIGQHAREELDELLGRKTHLFLHVKVNDRWQDDRALYAQFGLDFDA